MPSFGADEIFRIGGFMFSRTSVSVHVDGVPYTGIFELKGEESREGELVHGQRGDGTPLGITSGLYMPGPFSMKMYPDTAEQVLSQLSLLGLGSFGNALFTLNLQIFESLTLPTINLQWNKVKIEKRATPIQTDAGALAWEFECKHQGMQSVGEGLGLGGIPNLLANYIGSLP
jgi:hypothetical protein